MSRLCDKEQDARASGMACPDFGFLNASHVLRGHVANEWCYQVSPPCERFHIDPLRVPERPLDTYPFDCSDGCARCTDDG
eukprot:scaffold279555_cov31-Tisochrysis_lutea.AAC.1